MELYTFFLLQLLPCAFMFYQNEYDVIFERMEVVRYNTTYCAAYNTHNFKYNRTHAAVNQTYHYIVDFGNDLDMEVQTYKFASNEYRLFPVRFMYNYCSMVSKNEFGLKEQYNCGNCTGCPLKKGWFSICRWAPNPTKFPPNAPAGIYMFELKFFYRSTETLFLQVYATVKYPELPGMAINRG